MEVIRLIRDKSELRGTCYMELLPGEYRDRCWDDGSVFLAEDVFGLIEPIIEHHVPRFDHYSFVGIRRYAWGNIISDLDRLSSRAKIATCVGDLQGEVGFIFSSTEGEFAREFRANADALASLATELVGWLREQLREHECVSVLGM